MRIDTGFVVTNPDSYDSADTAVLVDINNVDNTVTLLNLDLGKRYTLSMIWAVTRDNQYSIEYSAQLEKVDIVPDQRLEDRIYATISSVQKPYHLTNICPGTWGPQCISLSGTARMRLIMTENEIFTCNMVLSEAYGNPINRDNITTEQLFKPYPVAFYSAAESSVSYVCFFDMTNHCFK